MKQFGDWLTEKYGTLDKAFAGWEDKEAVKGDDRAAGRVGFTALWKLFSDRRLRSQDTATFLATNMKTFYDGTYKFLKEDLGVKSAVYGSNWITASPQYLAPLDKWSNVGADFMDRHGYFGAPHTGPTSGYAISPGDQYDDRSALLFSPDKPGDPENYSLPLFDILYNNKPSTITEINHTPPNRFRADQPLANAAYGLLQGTDAFFFFASGTPGWEGTLGKFGVRTPVTAGQFPGAALLYRQGLVKPGPTVAEANLSVGDLTTLKGAPVTAPQNLDELRLKDVPGGRIAEPERLSSIDPLAFLTGKVRMNLGVEGAGKVMDLSKLIDRNAKVAKSATGELTWDWGKGRILVNAPQAQGATGFLKGWTAATVDATFTLPLEYGAVLLVSLDGKPIATSTRMLLQVMSEDQPSGWKTSAASGMRTIESVGHGPFVVKNLEGTIALKRPDAAKLRVTALDFNGYPKGKPTLGAPIKLQADTLYYLLEK
ncbi:hypothetical protein EON81_02825 [bacterium]|nr:MAG: hypothetical protein EON81_02825 [bacterium]